MPFDLKRRATFHRFRRTVSQKYGIVKNLIDVSGSNTFGPWHLNRTANADGKVIACPSFVGGHNSGYDPINVALGAFGEALERYCLGFTPTNLNRLRNVSYNSIRSENALSPDEMRFFTETQFNDKNFKIRPWTADLKVDWALGTDLSSGRPIWIPEDFISFGDYSSIYKNTSNGCALGESLEMATVNAICEVVERDSVLGYWWNKAVPPQIDLSTIKDPNSQAILALYRNAKINPVILNATSDLGIPVAIAVQYGNQAKRQAAFMMCASAGLSAEGTIRRALFELMQNSARASAVVGKRKFTENFDDEILGFEDAVIFHCQQENAHLSKFYLDGPSQSVEVMDVEGSWTDKERLLFLLQQLSRRHYRVLICDITTPDVRACGFFAVRAIIPGLIPLNFMHRYRPWGVPRIYDFKTRLNLAKRPISEKDIYPIPHPFP